MKFDTPATTNPIDQLKVVGKPHNRIDGVVKTTGTAPYAYERHDVAPNQAYGWVVGSTIAKGRIRSMDLGRARQRAGRDHDRDGRVRRHAPEGQPQYRQAAGRAADRPLPPGDRPGGGRDLGAGACRRAARSGRLRALTRELRPRESQGHGRQARAHHRRCARFRGGRLRRRVRSRTGAGRLHVHDAGHLARHDGAARDRRGLARRRAHGLDVAPDGRLGPHRPRADPRHRQEQGEADLALHRRRLRRQAVHPGRRPAGRPRRTRRAPPREGRPAAFLDRQQHGPSAGDDPARPARRDARRHASPRSGTRAGPATCRKASPTARCTRPACFTPARTG